MSRERERRTTNVSQIAIMNYDGEAATQYVNVYCPFIPDFVEVQAFMGYLGTGGASLAPYNAPGADVPGCDIFLTRLDCFPANAYVVANSTNTCNPIFRFENTSRQSFQGTYSTNSYNASYMEAMTGGQIVLQFNFIKYVD